MDRAEAEKLLSEYVLGQLDAGRAAAVADLLAGDADLRQLEQFLRWLQPRLQQMRDHLPGEHPTGEELVHAAVGQGSIPSDREDWVREHLQSCAECRRLADMIRQAEGQLAAQEDQTAGQASGPAGGPAPQWTKLAMAAVVALVLITSGIWLGQRDTGAPADRGPIVHLAGITRGQTGAADVSPSADGRLPLLVLECDPWVGRASADDFLLEIRLLERESRQVVTIWRTNARAAWSAEDMGVLLDPDSPAPTAGDYELEVRDDSGQVIFQTGFHLSPR
jgi:anti-sigma factor RsiW